MFEVRILHQLQKWSVIQIIYELLSVLTAIFLGGPGLAGIRMSPFFHFGFIAAKDNGGDEDNWSYKTCKAPVKSSPPINQHSVYRPDVLIAQPTVSVRALKEKPSLYKKNLIAWQIVYNHGLVTCNTCFRQRNDRVQYRTGWSLSSKYGYDSPDIFELWQVTAHQFTEFRGVSGGRLVVRIVAGRTSQRRLSLPNGIARSRSAEAARTSLCSCGIHSIINATQFLTHTTHTHWTPQLSGSTKHTRYKHRLHSLSQYRGCALGHGKGKGLSASVNVTTYKAVTPKANGTEHTNCAHGAVGLHVL